MTIQDSHWQAAVSPTTEGHGVPGVHLGTTDGNGRPGAGGAGRSAPLRVDAQRNLEHVLRAAREVFGELGYGAPMEDVARRARVGVGTVYRRFPSKDVLVRRIAEEETSRLTEQAKTALGQEEEPWSALSRFLRTSVASGAGRLLPPQVLRVGADPAEEAAAGVSAEGRDQARVPHQRAVDAGAGIGAAGVGGELRVVEQRAGAPVPGAAGSSVPGADDAGAADLLEVVGQLVDRARAAGELRGDVTVADVLLVIATAAPALPDPAHQAAASARLLDILLEGLRPR
ncbi:TetR/AcrR family transcriptional regulator [Streptomyces qinzhouensis]|uniref:Helix-turn-helix transcriptional regulator n=1 Tax=Streptomyces qinzhouensis TaxID=2599401 RepID=A0A5B8J773_9ACTN|nr:helix-turn-helix domain-containing protein [Streptomyces qinzhouensis]QDY77645.1 helix-turn-helix transcriptional regulator [Streptomyces qinzhouensis]